jgi:hypothetical protein
MKCVSCTCQSKGTTATITPVRPPMTKVTKKARIHIIGRLSCGLPFHSVPIQAKTCTPVGTATSVEAAEKKARPIWGMPVVNMWWTQSPKLRTPSASRRRHDPAVAQQRRACHHRQDHRDHPGGGQEDDVDFRMAEEPEEVLPQQAVAPVLGLEEGHPEGALELEQDRAQDQRREAPSESSPR